MALSFFRKPFRHQLRKWLFSARKSFGRSTRIGIEARYRPLLEALEDRTAPTAGLYVANSFFDHNLGADTSMPANGDTVDWPGGGQFAPVDNLIFGTSAFTSIQAAVNTATSGATIDVAPGTYNELVSVNQSVTIDGAQTGVDARTRSAAAESIVDGAVNGLNRTTSFYITANNVTVDGFTVEDQSDPNQFGAGVVMAATTSGVTIENDIVTNNAIGIFADSDGASLIQHNLFDGNNTAGPAGGAAIYSEQTANLTVDGNEFENQTQNDPVIFAALSTTSHTNLTFTNNYLHDNISGVYALAIDGGLFQGNTITTGGTATGLTFGGSDTNISVLDNVLDNNARGLRVANFQDAGFITANSNITAHFNSFANDSEFGLGVIDATSDGGSAIGYTGGTLNATANWWGDVTGPTNAANPGGVGSPLVTTGLDVGSSVSFTPWLVYSPDSDAATPGVQLQTSFTVTAFPANFAFTSTNNNYTILANAIDLVQSGQTITLSGVFDWTEPNAAASWALGNDGISGTADDYTIYAPANVNNVTLTAAALGDATIQGPGSITNLYLEGPLQFDTGNNGDRAYGASTNQNWTISNLNIFDFALGIAMFDNPGGNSAAFSGTHIVNNHIRLASDVLDTVNPADTIQNIGIYYSFGQNQLIQNNTIDLQGDGVSDSVNGNYSAEVGMQGDTSGGNVYDGLLIDGNTVNVLHAQSSDPEKIRGIWENTDGGNSNITVSNNTFTNLDAGNSPASNLQIGFRLTSPSSATTTVEYLDNQVDGANIGFQYYPGYNNTGTQPVQLIGNTLTNVFDGFDFTNAQTVNYLSGNSVTGTGSAGTGIGVGTGSTLTTDGVSGTNSIQGFATGVDVNGGTASLQQNTIFGNGTGVSVENGGSLTAATQNFITGNTSFGINIDASAGAVSAILDNDLSGNPTAVDNGTSGTLDASLNWWGSNTRAGVQGTLSGSVDYTPFLNSGTDTDLVTPGFQGDFSFLNVDVQSPQVGSVGRIQEGVNDVTSGGTVNVLDGTYAENVTITQALTLQGPNVGINPNTGHRGAEAVVEPGLTSSYDTSSIFTVQADNVTIDGFTIQGSISGTPPGGQSAGFTLTSGATVYAAAGISNSSNINTGGSAPSTVDISGLTVQNNVVQDFTQVGVYGDTSDGTPSTGNTITDNFITDIPNNGQGGYFGEGVIIYDNFYADITANTLTDVRTGIQTGNNYLSSGAFAPSISDNQVSAYVKGIYFNLQYESASTFTISDNTITQADATVSPVYNVGLLIQSIQSSVQAAIQGNNVSGFLYGVEFAGNSTTNTVTVQGGTLNNNTYGVWDTNNDYFYPAPYDTTAAVDGVDITNSTNAGIWIDSTSANSAGQFDTTDTTSLAITGGTSITGGAVGLLVDSALSLITGNTLNDTAFSGQSGNYITLSNGAEAGNTIDATAVSFGGVTGATATLAQNFAIENKITDAVDDSSLGFVRIKAGNVFVTPNSFNSPTTTAADIQRGIDVASSGDTVNVEAGTYVENGNFVDSVDGVVSELNIDKPLTLLGPNATFNPIVNPVPAGAQAIILPGTSDPNPFDSTAITIIGVNASNVTIEGFTINGDNPALAGDPHTIVYNGASIAASEGISSYDDVGNITVSSNIVENTAYTGIDFQNAYNTGSPGAATSNNLISENLLQNLGGGGFNYGIGVVIYNNFYADVTDNVMNTVRVGVQTGNFSNANPGGAGTASIADNQIAAVRRGIYYNLHYSNASPFTVMGNSITAVEDATSGTKWDGIMISSQQDAVSATFQDNTIDGSATAGNASQTSAGYDVWNTPTTGSMLISGGTVKGVDYGVWVNTYEGNNGPASNTQVTVSGVGITASHIGVYVEDSPLNGSATATAIVEGNTAIATGGAGTGILVSGATAAATIQNNAATITGNLIGIDVNAGTAAVNDNSITANATGISVENGGSLTSVTENFITNNTGDGILIKSTAGSISSIFDNDLSGNGGFAVDNLSGTLVDASVNWWGSNTRAGVQAAINGSVDYTPFLNSSTDTDLVTPGFQGDFSFLNVDAQSPQAGAVGRIDEGIDDVTTGGTVNVLPGTYTEDVDVNKDAIVQVGNPTTVAGNFSLSASGATLQMASPAAQLFVINFTAGAGTSIDLTLDNSTTPGTGYDQVVVSGTVSIDSAATINLTETPSFVPAKGSVFTLINNTGSSFISGTFANLADGSTVDLNGQSYKVNYEGGNGNDLTLTQLFPTAVYVGNNTPTDFAITNDVSPPGLSNGDTVTWNPGGAQHPLGTVSGLTFGYNAFISIQTALDNVSAGGIVYVEAGVYSEPISVTHAVTISGAPGATFSGTGALSANLTLLGFGSFTFTSLSGSGNLTVGSGTVKLPNDDSGDSGTTTVTAGTLVVGDDNALGSGFLQLNGGTLTASAPVILANAFAVGGAAAIGGSHAITFSTGGGTLSASNTLTVTNTSTTTFSSVIGGTGNLTQSAGLVVLGNANLYAGQTSVNGGTMRLTNAGATISSSSVVVAAGARLEAAADNTELANVIIKTGSFLRLSNPMDTGAGASVPTTPVAGTLEINNAAIGADYDGVQLANGSKVTSLVTGATYASDLTLAGANVNFDTSGSGGSFTVSGVISDGGNGYGITKIGLNTLTLSATDTYTGSTNVNGGTLMLPGAGSITSNVQVNIDGTLAGSGTVNGSVIANAGGLVAPGLTPAPLNTGSVAMVSSSTFQVTLNSATAYSQLNVAGSVNLGNTLQVTLGYTPVAGTVFTLINNDGSDPVNGTFQGLPNGAIVSLGGVFFHIYYNGGDGNDVVLQTNSPPHLTINNAVVAGTEGVAATNSGTYSDPDPGDTVTVTASIGTITQSVGTWNWSYTPTSGLPTSDMVIITATDSVGARTSKSFTLNVTNQPPTLAVNTAIVSALEGATTSNSGSFGDPGSTDSVTISASLGTVSQTGTSSGTWSWSYTPTAPIPAGQTVTITATDANHAATTQTFTLNVTNLPPSLTLNSTTVTVNEGSAASNSGTFADPGSTDDVTVTASIGVITHQDIGSSGNWTWSYTPTSGIPASQIVIITATDEAGATATQSFTLNVTTVPPTLTIAKPTVTVLEGAVAGNNGTFADAGSSDTVTVTSSIGAITQDSGSHGNWSWSYTPTAPIPAGQTVTITATDSDHSATTQTFTLNVTNLPPSLTLNSTTVTVNEGSPASNSGTFGDPGSTDTVIVTASIGAIIQSAGTWSWSYTPTSGLPTSEMVTITATDSVGAQTSKSFTLNVTNQPPTLAVNAAIVSALEGVTTNNSGSFGDPGATDTVTITASLGTVSQTGTSSGTWSWAYTPTSPIPASQTVTITATDANHAATMQTFTLKVINLPPSLTLNSATVTVNEGSPASDSGTFADPGSTDDVTVTASIGAITHQDIGSSGNWTWSYTPTSGIPASQIVIITATDEAGATATQSFTLHVTTVPPTLTIANSTVTVDEGSPASNNGTFADAGSSDTVTVTSSIGVITQDSGSHGNWSWSYTPPSGLPAGQTVTITATAAGGAATTQTFTLNVTNVAPANLSLMLTPTPIAANQPASLAGTFTDPGAQDTHTVLINWGDGTPNTTTNLAGGVTSFSGIAHTYQTSATFTITVTVTDANSASVVNTLPVNVQAFSDNFNQANGSPLNSNSWTVRLGNFSIENQAAVGTGTTNSATVKGLALSNVLVSATFSLGASPPVNAFAGLVARYTGSGEGNCYQGALVQTSSGLKPVIKMHLNGTWTNLTSGAIIPPATGGTLAFEVVGSSLKLFFNNQLVAHTFNSKLTSGTVGMRATTGVSLGHYAAVGVPVAAVTTLPFMDNFTQPGYGSQLSQQWTGQLGNFTIQSSAAAGTGTLNLATVTGLVQSDVTVSANIALGSNPPLNDSGGLEARFSGSGDGNCYLGALVQTSTGLKPVIKMHRNGIWTNLVSGAIIPAATSGLVEFQVVGSSLKLFFNGNLVAQATNTALKSGTVGMRANQGVSWSNFSAS